MLPINVRAGERAVVLVLANSEVRNLRSFVHCAQGLSRRFTGTLAEQAQSRVMSHVVNVAPGADVVTNGVRSAVTHYRCRDGPAGAGVTALVGGRTGTTIATEGLA